MTELYPDNVEGEIIECRFAIGPILIKILPFVTICLFLAVLASFQLASSLPKILLLAVLTITGVVFMITLTKNIPRAVLCRGTLSIWCHRSEQGGISKRAEQLRIPLHQIDRWWVGKPKDYQAAWPCPGFEWRSYYFSKTMILWLKGKSEPYELREFSWLKDTDKLLNAMESRGLAVEGPGRRTSSEAHLG